MTCKLERNDSILSVDRSCYFSFMPFDWYIAKEYSLFQFDSQLTYFKH